MLTNLHTARSAADASKSILPDEIRRPASVRAAQGRVLAFDDEEGTGVISGDNGSRYSFIIQEWRSQSPPQPVMHVDFVSDDHEAMDIYGLSEQPSGTGTTHYSGSSATQSLGTGSKSKVAAGLFGIFLGWLGIHKFYLGYTVPGIILLVAGIIGFFLFFPAVVAAIIGIIEGILYLTKSDEEFDRVYVRGPTSVVLGWMWRVAPVKLGLIYFPNGVGHRWQAACCLGATSMRGGSMTSQVPEIA